MLSTTVSSFIFILISSLLGMPISTTHSDVGALVGAGLAGVSVHNLNWNRVGATAVSWVLSPLVTGSLSAVLFCIVCTATLGNFFSVNYRVFNLTIMTGFCFAVTGFMVMGLVERNIAFSRVYIAVIVCFFVGILGSRAFLFYTANKRKRQ